jgi:hypothetical protein
VGEVISGEKSSEVCVLRRIVLEQNLERSVEGREIVTRPGRIVDVAL